MSAYEVETLLGGAMVTTAILWSLFELPSWIVRRCER